MKCTLLYKIAWEPPAETANAYINDSNRSTNCLGNPLNLSVGGVALFFVDKEADEKGKRAKCSGNRAFYYFFDLWGTFACDSNDIILAMVRIGVTWDILFNPCGANINGYHCLPKQSETDNFKISQMVIFIRTFLFCNCSGYVWNVIFVC